MTRRLAALAAATALAAGLLTACADDSHDCDSSAPAVAVAAFEQPGAVASSKPSRSKPKPSKPKPAKTHYVVVHHDDDCDDD